MNVDDVDGCNFLDRVFDDDDFVVDGLMLRETYEG